MARIKSIAKRVLLIDTRRNPTPVVERERGRPAARARLRVLKRDKFLCQECLTMGRVVVADEVDHTVPLHLGGCDSDANKRSICKSCHLEKTNKENSNRK